jgi:RNA recognition motif-containing protein
MEHRLYVGNLADDVSTEALRTRFAQCGAVTDVELAVDRSSGRMRGYAFVTMATAADARSAIEQLNGAMFEDRPLRVNEAGAERDGSRASKANAEAKQRRARITSQFRERRNMAYELECDGVKLVLRVFPEDETERSWRIEGSIKGATEDTPPVVRSASAPTRAAALDELIRTWTAADVGVAGAAVLDWAAVVDAMQGIRAI